MGLFNKKKLKVKLKVDNNSGYDPWVGNNSSSTYSIANFLDYLDNKPIGDSNDSYPRYVSYDLNIHNPIKMHNQLLCDGYLIPAPPSVVLQSLSVAELKSILQQHNLSTVGKKAVLIQSIIDNVATDNIGLKTFFTLSSKGKAYVNKFHYYIDVRPYLSKGIFSLQEFEEQKNKRSYLSVEDLVWFIYNDKYSYYSINYHHEFLRNINYERYELLLNEGKKKDALVFLLATIYFDINGTSKFHNYADFYINNTLASNVFELSQEYDETVLKKVYRIAQSAIEMSIKAASKPQSHCNTLILYETFSRDILEDIFQKLLHGNNVDLDYYKQYANPKCFS